MSRLKSTNRFSVARYCGPLLLRGLLHYLRRLQMWARRQSHQIKQDNPCLPLERNTVQTWRSCRQLAVDAGEIDADVWGELDEEVGRSMSTPLLSNRPGNFSVVVTSKRSRRGTSKKKKSSMSTHGSVAKRKKIEGVERCWHCHREFNQYRLGVLKHKYTQYFHVSCLDKLALPCPA